MVEQIISFLESCRYEQDWLYLNGIGWLTVRAVPPVRSTNAETGEVTEMVGRRMPWLSSDPNLERALNGLPQFDHVYLCGRERLFAGSDVRDESAHFDIVSPPEMNALAEKIRQEVLSDGACDLPDLGRFVVKERRQLEQKDDGSIVRTPLKSFRLKFAAQLAERIGRREPPIRQDTLAMTLHVLR